MSWRKHETHRAESAAVRAALRRAGINARVGHGKGTAWAWLKINIGSGQQWGEHDRDNGTCSVSCLRCQRMKTMRLRVIEIVQAITGRHGDYDGEILVEGW